MNSEKGASRRWVDLGGAASPAFVREGAAELVLAYEASTRAGTLAGRVEAALAAGVAAQDALVLCADPSSAARMRARLAETGVSVMTCRELACSVLGQPECAEELGLAFTGGRTRLLAAYEADFVVEDVKTLGTAPKRLRELLKFLYRGWTELSDEDPAWLFTVEEINTFDFLNNELAYLGAVMEPQLSNLATKLLRLSAAASSRLACRRVFVLDYQNLSRASQLLCQLVAGEVLVVVADDACCAEVHESYPCLEGVGRFVELNPAACVERMDPASTQPVRSERVWDVPAHEADGVAAEIAEAVAGGCNPADVAVMAPHPWWIRQVERGLASRGVPTNAWYGALKLRGDIRELERCLAPRAVTLLRLLADPHDAVAWRSWFGFGDYLTRSNLFDEMRKTVEPSGDVRRDLKAFGYNLGADLDPLFAEVRELRGAALVGYLVETLAGVDAPVPAALRPLCALGEDADAAQMVAWLDHAQFFGGIPMGDGVVLAPYDAMAGLDFAQVYAVGMVNGLFPKKAYFDLTQVSINKQKKMGDEDLRTAHAMANLGREGLHVSRFERAETKFADLVGLKQARIVAADDSGVAESEVAASIYTDVLMGRA